MPQPKKSKPAAKSAPALIDEEAQAKSLLAEALGTSPKKPAKQLFTGAPMAPLSVPSMVPPSPSGPPQMAPTATGASRCWKSRRAIYAHLPPITVNLISAGGGRQELRVDAQARAGDLMRDLCSGGPQRGLLERVLGVPEVHTPRRTPRAVVQAALRITGLVHRGEPLHNRHRLEEGGEYEVATTERGAEEGIAEDMLAGAAAALGVVDADSSDWSDDDDDELAALR